MGIISLVGALVKVVLGTVFGWVFLTAVQSSGQLPPDPLGLAAMGLPATLFGLPTYAVGAILLFDLLLLFGNSGGVRIGDPHDHDGGFDAEFGDE